MDTASIKAASRIFFRATATERIIQGLPYAGAVASELDHYASAKAHVVTGRSLHSSALFQSLADGLGSRLAGVSAAIAAHTPREAVLQAAEEVRTSGADMLVAFGGGSVIDAVKMIQLCVWNGIESYDDFDRHMPPVRADPSGRPDPGRHRLRAIAVPTTFSAAEFNWYAGCTDTRRSIKQGFSHPYFVPRTIILDPAATAATPVSLLLSTGVKAVDHAVERLCSASANALGDTLSEKALSLLSRALPAIATDRSDQAAIADAQVGMWLSTSGSAAGVATGASHGVGHQLGAHCGVPHGLTSCVLLPSVLRWNEPVNADRQKIVARAMGSKAPAWRAVRDLISSLGLPTRLRDVGIARAQLEGLAQRAMHDHSTQQNPRPIASAKDVLEILELAW